MRGGEPALGLSTGRVREMVGKRESDLNAVGPKPANSGSTGQTGRLYRSDRSGLNWPKLGKKSFPPMVCGANSRN